MFKILENVLWILVGMGIQYAIDRFRNRLQIEVNCGSYTSVGDEGLLVTVRNYGATEVPHYVIAVFHPARGTISWDIEGDQGPLLPDQKRQHKIPLKKAGKVDDWTAKWIKRHDPSMPRMSSLDKRYEFQLRLRSSDVVLYRYSPIGRHILRSAIAATGQEIPPDLLPERWDDCNDFSWQTRRRQRRELKEHLRRAEASKPK